MVSLIPNFITYLKEINIDLGGRCGNECTCFWITLWRDNSSDVVVVCLGRTYYERRNIGVAGEIITTSVHRPMYVIGTH
jgi:hypothetical protein